MGLQWVEPGRLRLPTSRIEGADPVKLADQFRRHGSGTAGMPPIQVTEGADGERMINDGVTRATRIHRYAPAGTLVSIEVIETRPKWRLGHLPTIAER